MKTSSHTDTKTEYKQRAESIAPQLGDDCLVSQRLGRSIKNYNGENTVPTGEDCLVSQGLGRGIMLKTQFQLVKTALYLKD